MRHIERERESEEEGESEGEGVQYDLQSVVAILNLKSLVFVQIFLGFFL